MRAPYLFVVFIILAAVGSCPGCIVLPIPHLRTHQFGVKGQVVDACTNQPIAGAVVAPDITRSTGETSSTNASGRFTIDPKRGWHCAYLCGVVSFSLCPDLDIVAPMRVLLISAPGYESQQFTVIAGADHVDLSPTRKAGPVPVSASMNDDYLENACIRLVPKSPAAQSIPHNHTE